MRAGEGGMQGAKERVLRNGGWRGQEGGDMGRVSGVIGDGALDAEAAQVAGALAAGPTRAFGKTRRLLRQTFETSLADQLHGEVEAIIEASRSEDAAEGIAAFAAKRLPDFRGR